MVCPCEYGKELLKKNCAPWSWFVRMRWSGRISHIGDMRIAHKILVGKSEKKRPLR